MGNFQNLKVWLRAKDLAVQIYRVTDGGKFARDFGLRDQMRRAAVSIASNIAEGDELKTNKQSSVFFHTAKGSCAEVLTQAVIAHEIGHIGPDEFSYVKGECQAISSMLTRLIQAREERPT